VKYSLNPKACIESLDETIYGYARRVNPNVFSITCETPYIYSKTLEDNTPSGTKLKDLYLSMIRMITPIARLVETIVKKLIPYIDEKSPYLLEAKEYMLGWGNKLEPLRRRVIIGKEYERESSKAEEFDVVIVKSLWSTLLKIGIALRLISKCGKKYLNVNINEATEDLTSTFEGLYSKLTHYDIRYVSLKNQVAIQFHTILLTIKHALNY